jgi:hypothetical protein
MSGKVINSEPIPCKKTILALDSLMHCFSSVLVVMFLNYYTVLVASIATDLNVELKQHF